MGYEIESNEDNSVTLTRGAVHVRISAETWKEANDAAHLLALTVERQYETRRAMTQLRTMTGLLKTLQEQLSSAEETTRLIASAVPGMTREERRCAKKSRPR